MDKVCKSLDKLRLNIEEYQNYLEFKPLFDYFKDEFINLIPKLDVKESKDSKAHRAFPKD